MSNLMSSLEHFCGTAEKADIQEIMNEVDLFARIGIDIKPFVVVCLLNLLNRLTEEREYYRKKCEDIGES